MAFYRPSVEVEPDTNVAIAQLSQRDLALDIPINFVPAPGVVLTSACFPNGSYTLPAAGVCISNLLSLGFGRMILDLYWDPSTSVWSLCPVQLGSSTNSTRGDELTSSSITSAATSALQTGLVGSTLTDDRLRAIRSLVQPTPVASQHGEAHVRRLLAPRQDIAVTENGVECSRSLDFLYVTRVLGEYLDLTGSNLNATLQYMILNLHAAAPPTNVSSGSSSIQSLQPSQLPSQDSLISTLLTQNLSKYLYSPADLSAQRANVNGTDSWYSSPLTYAPDTSYFNLSTNDTLSTTENGWPGEGYVELREAKRLIVGFGQIDPQLQAYNTSSDASTVFPAGYILRTEEDASSCEFSLNDATITNSNNSWAVETIAGLESSSVGPRAEALVQCGISPVLNQTLDGKTADQDLSGYFWFAANSSIWSWAAGEPKDQRSDGQRLRCAALNVSSGRWQARRCGETHHGACRQSSLPFSWVIASGSASYTSVSAGCGEDASFDVPRTAIENRYLLASWRQWNESDVDSDGDDLIWLNLNDLDRTSCWVEGQYTICPYRGEDMGQRTITVPAVAAVIVLVIAALTLFVKCASNRRSSKRRRRRGNDGWDYEGVPL